VDCFAEKQQGCTVLPSKERGREEKEGREVREKASNLNGGAQRTSGPMEMDSEAAAAVAVAPLLECVMIFTTPPINKPCFHFLCFGGGEGRVRTLIPHSSPCFRMYHISRSGQFKMLRRGSGLLVAVGW
jgi:hypothetical protein